MSDGLPFYNRADYDSYLKRLSLYPRQNADALSITRQAISPRFAIRILLNIGLVLVG